MAQKIYPCLWFNNNAPEAVRFYTALFKNSSIGTTLRYDKNSARVSGQKEGSVLTIAFKLLGQDFLALNGGPLFKFTPAISFFVYCSTSKEVDRLYKALSKGGEVMMALDKYPFSDRYAFLKDRFGVSWQVMLSPQGKGIAPCLLFVGKSLGYAKPAIAFYSKAFKQSKINSMIMYPKNDSGKNLVMHSSFSLLGSEFTAMDGQGNHQFGFTMATSFVVNCKTQKEIDYYWDTLSKGGQKSQCGWLIDKFGVSWQITPSVMNKMMASKDKEKVKRVMAAMLKMAKLDIKKLEEAYNQK